MKLTMTLFLVAVGVAGAQTPSSPRVSVPPPLVDHHQHLFSSALAALVSPPPPAAPIPSLTARELVAYLDAAGIKRAALLSVAYSFSNPARNVDNDYAKVKAENDWNATQIQQFPERLVGFCGINPIKDYALEELARCAQIPELRKGLKLHFGNSVVDYHNPDHIRRLQRVFRAANAAQMALVIHMRSSISQRVAYGREEALIFLNALVPEAPDVTIQIAHLAGGGDYDDPLVDQALSVFVDAIQRHDPRTRHLYFDVSGVVGARFEHGVAVAQRIRQLGMTRVLYGTDTAMPSNQPRDGWTNFRKLPLTDAEFSAIALNVAPYMQ